MASGLTGWAGPVTLENENVEFGFDPKAGGTCVEVAVKNTNAPLTLQPGYVLLRAIFDPEQAEKPAAPIDFAVTPTNDPQKGAGLAFRAVLTETNSSRDVADMTFERRVWLPPGKRRLEVEEALFNGTADVMGARVGIVNRFLLAGRKDSNIYYLPAERTILKVVANSIARFYTWSDPWDYTPVEPWVAAANPDSAWSLVFVLDPKYTDAFYAATIGSGLGWLVDGGIVEPGSAFRTTYAVIPVRGFKGFVHATRRLLADVEMETAGAGPALRHTLAGGIEPLGKMTVETVVMGARSKQETRLAAAEFDAVGLEGVSRSVSLAQTPIEPLVIKVTAKGAGWQESYEAYYEGKFQSTIYPGYPWVPEYKRKKAF